MTADRTVQVVVIDRDAARAAGIVSLVREPFGLSLTVSCSPTSSEAAATIQPNCIGILVIDTAGKTAGAIGGEVRDAVSAGIRSPIVILDGARAAGFDGELLASGAVDYCWHQELSPPLLEAQIRHAVEYIAREQVQRRLEQSHRMETVGRLAGGIAHDLNNILTAVIGFATLLAEQVAADPVADRCAREVLTAADRASTLTRQLLAFGRRQVLRPARIDLHETLEDLAPMVRQLTGDGIDFDLVSSPGLPIVHADRGQIEASLLSLVANARDAMPHGGTLMIVAEAVDVDIAYCDQHPPMTPGSYVRVAITDTGAGIPRQLQGRIFEPFFSRNDDNKSTGLGLATVYGTIKQSGGFIWLSSEPDSGTCFEIYLPIDPSVETIAPAPLAPEPQPLERAATILLVEDSRGVRDLTREVLRRAGYTVLEAHDAEQALTISGAHDGDIDLLLTDVIMPGATGIELASQFRETRRCPVLFMSGYTDVAILRGGLLTKDTPFLQKPFTPQELLHKLHEVLEVSS